jgi:phytoene desaturase
VANAVIIGAGIGGLCAGLRLRSAGHDVTIVEPDVVGGKLRSKSITDFHFDVGPSLLTLPGVFEDLCSSLGHSLGDLVELQRLEHPFRHNFADGSTLDVFDDPQRTEESFEAFSTGAGAQWRSLQDRAQSIWEVSERTFLAGPMGSPVQLLRRMRSPKDFAQIDALTTLAKRAQNTFDDPRLQQWLNRFATYSGSDPWQTPATLACIAHVEQHFGAWHVKGGLGGLAKALEQVGRDSGIAFVNQAVEAIDTKLGATTAVILDDGSRLAADVVVSNVEPTTLYGKLLPNQLKLRKTRKATRSTGGFAMLVGLDGITPAAAHHNLFYSADQRREFAEIERTGTATEPTIYVCNPKVSDPTMSPENTEAWFVLVNTTADAAVDWAGYEQSIIERLGVADRLKFSEQITPADMAKQFDSPDGAIYGTSSNGRRAAFLRASNRGSVRGLYLCGGAAHPGGGLPMVATSGRIAADMAIKDFQ